MSNKLRWKTMFLKDGNLVSQHSQDETWTVGEWRHQDVDPKLCKQGFHCSKRVVEAMGYVNGGIVARVAVKGAADVQDDKEAYASMRIVAAYSWTREDSVALAVFAAERVLPIFEAARPGDDRPRKAIEVARKYLETGAADADAAAYADAAYAAYADAAADAAYAADAADAAADAAYAADAAADADATTAAAAYAAAAYRRAAEADPKGKKKLKKDIEAWIQNRLTGKELAL